jgi:hypothetical protein
MLGREESMRTKSALAGLAVLLVGVALVKKHQKKTANQGTSGSGG